MFDTLKVGQKIREARTARNMTQMSLADEMGVSYQAVSNWERGSSMPDISKLEQLCNTLHITIYELLGTEDPQTNTVSRILSKEELPEAEEVAEIAPIVPPEQLKEAVSETARKRSINWDAIMRMAPFLDWETLDGILENVEPGDYGRIIGLAPFISRQTLDKLVIDGKGKIDNHTICALAPFLSRSALEALVIRYDGEVNRELLAGLAPFLGKETLEKLLFRWEGEIDMEMVDHLAPFLGRDTMGKLVEKLLEQGNVGNLSHLYPFLGRDTMRKLVKKMMDDGDFDSMRDAAVFL